MNNANEIFELLVNADESLSGSYWEELSYSYLDTPKNIVDDVINTYMNNEIFGMEDVTETDKKLALAKYFRYVADTLNVNQDNDILMHAENNMIIACLKDLPFNITALETNNDDECLRYNMTIATSYGCDVASIEISKNTLIKNKQIKDEPKHKYLRMVAKAIENEYDKKLETLLNNNKEDEKAIRTAVIIHARISLLVETLDNNSSLRTNRTTEDIKGK